MTEDPWYWNITFFSVVAAWTTAQGIKFISNLIKNKKLDFTYFVSTGGMPSAHTASVTGLATSVGLQTGFSEPLFAVAATFAMVVMFDAQSVRRAAGQQARVLNKIVEEFFARHKHLQHGRLKELLGHTRLEVFAGMAVGISVAYLLTTKLLP